jgi:hypothetical protein
MHITVSAVDSRHEVSLTEITAEERPPMVELEEYRKKFGAARPG